MLFMINFLIRSGKLIWKHASFWHLKRILTFLCVDIVLLSFVRRKQSNAVLLVKFDLLGDYIICRNFLRTVRNYPPFQSRKIILCANQAIREFIETYEKDAIDDFVWVNRARFLNEFWYRFEILRQIKEIGAQTVLNALYFREPYLSDSLVWATRAPERIGQEGFKNPNAPSRDLKGPHIELKTFPYTKLVLKNHRITFDFYRNHTFFNQAIPGAHLPENTRFTPIPVEIPKVAGPFVALLPGASESFREWPPERFAEVGRHLFLNHGLRSVVIGSRADHSKALTIQKCIPEIPTDNLCGQLTLPQVIYLMSKCEIGITNDSGGIHILAAINKRGIAISNCNSFGLFSPYPKQISDTVSFVYPPAFYAMNLSWRERTELLGRKQKYFSIADITSGAVIARADALLRGIPHHDPIQEMCDRDSLRELDP